MIHGPSPWSPAGGRPQIAATTVSRTAPNPTQRSARTERGAPRSAGRGRRRLDLALGLVSRPDVLFVDEPTTGFDPAARRRSWELIRRLRADGTTILLTTHYLDEAEALADRVVVLAGGRVIAEGAPGDITGASDALIAFNLPPGVSAGELPVPAGAAAAPTGASPSGPRARPASSPRCSPGPPTAATSSAPCP